MNAHNTREYYKDNHSDTSCITSTLDGNHRPSDLLIEPVNTTLSYGKPYVPNTYGRPNVTQLCYFLTKGMYGFGIVMAKNIIHEQDKTYTYVYNCIYIYIYV